MASALTGPLITITSPDIGPFMAPSILANFQSLVRGMTKLAPDALKNKGTRVIAEAKPLREMTYTSLDDLDRESRCILSAQLGARDQPGST